MSLRVTASARLRRRTSFSRCDAAILTSGIGIESSDWNPFAHRTTIAAGRACHPCLLTTVVSRWTEVLRDSTSATGNPGRLANADLPERLGQADAVVAETAVGLVREVGADH